MRYVPNLIPKTSKVLPDYFKGNVYRAGRKNIFFTVVGWLLGIFFSLGALVSIPHPMLALLYGMLGFILLPPGHYWIEKTLRFRFKTKPKAIFAGILLLISFPLVSRYASIDKKAAQQQQLVEQQEQKEHELAAQKDRQRKDNLNFYLQSANKLEGEP